MHELKDITLDLIATKCEEYQEELNITKQGLFQRLDNGSDFLKNFFVAGKVIIGYSRGQTTDG